MEDKNWLRMELDDGWQCVMPATDIRPHAPISAEEAERLKTLPDTRLEVADLDCPCTPKVDYLNKIIVHNSFEDKARVDAAMENPGIIS